MKLVFVFLSLLASSLSDPHVIKVQKLLNNGDPIGAAVSLDFSIEENWNTDPANLKVDFNFDVPEGYKSVSNSKLFFANDDKQITEVVFETGRITAFKWRKPWNPAEQGIESVPDDTVKSTSASVTIYPAWLPVNVTRISASVTAVNNADQNVVFNYYGIKNFAIAIPDTQIVENYQPEDLIQVTL